MNYDILPPELPDKQLELLVQLLGPRAGRLQLWELLLLQGRLRGQGTCCSSSYCCSRHWMLLLGAALG